MGCNHKSSQEKEIAKRIVFETSFHKEHYKKRVMSSSSLLDSSASSILGASTWIRRKDGRPVPIQQQDEEGGGTEPGDVYLQHAIWNWKKLNYYR